MRDNTLDFLTADEKAAYEKTQAKLKAQREKAVRRKKEHDKIYRYIDEHEDEVQNYLNAKSDSRRKAAESKPLADFSGIRKQQ